MYKAHKLTNESDPYLFAGLVQLAQEKEDEELPFSAPIHLVSFLEKQGYHVVTDSDLGCGGEV